jgi:hypothetical protein
VGNKKENLGIINIVGKKLCFFLLNLYADLQVIAEQNNEFENPNKVQIRWKIRVNHKHINNNKNKFMKTPIIGDKSYQSFL